MITHSTVCRVMSRSVSIEGIEDRLILGAGVRAPVRREPVAPPGVREVGELPRRDRRAGFVAVLFEPTGYVLFRPEEIHRASGEDDVVPPPFGGDDDVEEVLIG